MYYNTRGSGGNGAPKPTKNIFFYLTNIKTTLNTGDSISFKLQIILSILFLEKATAHKKLQTLTIAFKTMMIDFLSNGFCSFNQ